MRCSNGVEVIDVFFSEKFLSGLSNKFEFIEWLEVTFYKEIFVLSFRSVENMFVGR